MNTQKIENYKEYQFEWKQFGTKPMVLCKKITNRSKYGYKIEFNYYFSNEERAIEYVNEFINKIEILEKRKQESKIKKKAAQEEGLKSELVKPGTIFYQSWGYEQTNINFYQVIAIKGRTAIFREIASEEVPGSMYSHGMACQVRPVKDSFKGDEFKKLIVFAEFGVYVNFNSYSNLSIYENGKDGIYKSWYY